METAFCSGSCWSVFCFHLERSTIYIACRLIPIDKRLGFRLIGVREVLKRIAGKAVMILLKKDTLQAAGLLQLCGGQVARSEAAIHAMHDVFNDDDTESILLIDEENAFNSINRKVIPHNLKFICPVIATYISNCYMYPARLFIIGGEELYPKEGTTQGDPTSMGAYALGILLLLRFRLDFISVSLLLPMTLRFLANYQALKTTGAN